MDAYESCVAAQAVANNITLIEAYVSAIRNISVGIGRFKVRANINIETYAAKIRVAVRVFPI